MSVSAPTSPVGRCYADRVIQFHDYRYMVESIASHVNIGKHHKQSMDPSLHDDRSCEPLQSVLEEPERPTIPSIPN